MSIQRIAALLLLFSIASGIVSGQDTNIIAFLGAESPQDQVQRTGPAGNADGELGLAMVSKLLFKGFNFRAQHVAPAVQNGLNGLHQFLFFHGGFGG